MAKRKNRELLKRRESGAYLAVPHVMLRSHTRSTLSPKAANYYSTCGVSLIHLIMAIFALPGN